MDLRHHVTSSTDKSNNNANGNAEKKQWGR